MELLELHLFAGAGGGILGGHLLGHRVIGAVEIEAYPRKVLLARQLDGSLPRFPIWDDVTTFRLDNPDTRNYIERLQSVRDRLVICGGFPCQDISAAGKGAGIEGARSGMWKEMARIISEIRPKYAFVENSPMLTTRGLGVVLADLASMGFDAEWCVLGASDIGFSSHRKRLWLVANSDKKRVSRPSKGSGFNKTLREAAELRRVFSKDGIRSSLERWDIAGRPSCDAESPLRRANDGLACWNDRLKAIGNGQVPSVAATAFELLRERLEQ
jgi:DNA (cytosine-5)-methyltransferase 1